MQILDHTISYVLNVTRKYAVGIEQSMPYTLEKVYLETKSKCAKAMLRKNKKGFQINESVLEKRGEYLGADF